MDNEKTTRETCEFVCLDPSGNEIKVIAERSVVRALIFKRRDEWRFRTDDGRAVRRGRYCGEFVTVRDREPLTTCDPREPREDGDI